MRPRIFPVETYADAMTNPQNTSDSKDPLKWVFLLPKSVCQNRVRRKPGFWPFRAFSEITDPLESLKIFGGAPMRS